MSSELIGEVLGNIWFLLLVCYIIFRITKRIKKDKNEQTNIEA